MPDKNKFKKKGYCFLKFYIHENEIIHDNFVNNIGMRKENISFIDIISLMFIFLIIILYFYFSYLSIRISQTENNYLFDN